MAKERIGSNAIFTGPQQGLTVIGDHCYAYSGTTTVTNTVNTVLEFNSGKEYLKVKIAFYSNGISNDDYNQIIYLNGNAVVSQTVPQTYQSTATGYQPIDLVITPNTHVKITLANVTDTSSNIWTTVLTGRVYS